MSSFNEVADFFGPVIEIEDRDLLMLNPDDEAPGMDAQLIYGEATPEKFIEHV